MRAWFVCSGANGDFFVAGADPERLGSRIVAIVSRLPRQAALACLVVALLSQVLLPAMHALVHYQERHGHGHSHAKPHGARQLAWVIERAGGAKAKSKAGGKAVSLRLHAHGGAPHTHEPSHESSPEPGAPAPHRHDGDQPGGPHGGSSLEHFTAFYLEATPPKLAVPFRFVAKEPVLLVEGRLAQAPIVSAQPVRGPPRES